MDKILELIGVGLWIAAAIAWITHIVTCIQASAWALLIIGAIIPPIGTIHGAMIWLNIPWT